MSQDLAQFAGTPCLNCGHELTGPFCAQCGQRATDVNLSVRTLVVEFAESLFSWELGFWQTFKRLVFMPGALSAEYIVGRRKRYSSPIKLYLGTSLVFFFLAGILGGDGENTRIQVVDNSGEKVELTGSEATDALRDGLGEAMGDSIAAAQADSALQEVIADLPAGEHLGKALKEPGAMERRFMAYFPRAMFLMVPLAAFLFSLVYYRRKRPFLHYLVFALHMHALFYFTASVAMLLGQIPPENVGDSLALVALLSFPVNIVRAQRQVFHDGWFKAFLRASLVWHVYGFFLTVVVVAIGAWLIMGAG